MGMPGPYSRSVISDCGSKTAPNPNPKKCTVQTAYTNDDYTVLSIKYDGCTNFEGYKILVFRGPLAPIIEQRVFGGGIDPHFSASTNVLHPMARFEPTDGGWEMACKLVEGLSGKKFRMVKA